MKKKTFALLLTFCCFGISATAVAQSMEQVVSRQIKAINYKVAGGTTTIDFVPTELLPGSAGEAKVQSKQGFTQIDASFMNMPLATKFGSEYLTYVLWSVSTEGRVSNLGELQLNDGKGTMKVTTQLQVFALAVTAEPYFAVRKPSTKLVLLNEPRDKVKGKLFLLDAQFDLLEWSQYKKLSNPLGMTVDLKQFPLDLYEARNAINIAQMLEAEKYAGDIFERAKQSLKMAEDAAANKKSRKEISTNARQAVQFSEDARALSIKRQEEEALAAQRAREAQSKLDAQRAERERQAEAARRAQAEQDRLKAELAAAQEKQRRAEAEAARARAQAEEERANKAAAEAAKAAEQANREARQAREAEEEARQAALKSAREKAELRAKLLEQFNAILETKDTERGLVVNMGDVLFDTGRYTLRPLAREKLARLSGIVLAYPGLSLQSEGHTDNVGGEAFNQKLSEQRANAVRDYLVSQGIPADKVTAVGKGFSMPVEDNKTAAGRQKNRRVELIVSGEVIGAKIETIR